MRISKIKFLFSMTNNIDYILFRTYFSFQSMFVTVDGNLVFEIRILAKNKYKSFYKFKLNNNIINKN